METISAAELQRRLSGNIPPVLIDVRTPAEFDEMHVQGAINIPLGKFSIDNLRSRGISSTLIYFICRSGGRSKQACELCEASEGYRAITIDGGTTAAAAAGIPIERSGRKVMSLERQVRIAAGSLVLVGVMLGFSLSPAFFYLSAFVGAGLVFAGVTDTCAMGLLLGQMPWNQSKH